MDQSEINLLSIKLVESRNYIETKKNVDEKILYRYEEYKYKCHEIIPPKISQNFEVRYESFTMNFSDKVGNYVQKKLDLMKEADDFYSELFYYARMYLYIVCAMSFLISMYTGLNLSHNKKVNYE